MTFTVRTFALAAAAGALSTTAFAQIQFQQIANINLATSFTGADSNFAAGRHGDIVDGVVFDGTNAYVSGINGSTKRAGVVKIANALTPGATAAHYFTQTTVGGATSSPVGTKLAVDGNGAVYYGYGLTKSTTASDNGSGTSTAFGIKKIIGVDTLDTGFGSSGFLAFNVATGRGASGASGRLDSFTYDPGSNQLYGVNFFDSKVHKISAATGAYNGFNTFSAGSSATGDVSGNYRDVDYDPATGRFFTRSAVSTGNANFTNRNGVESYTFDGSGNQLTRSNLAVASALDNDAARVSFGKAITGMFGEYLVYNDQVSNNLQVIDATTGAVLTTIAGTENGLGAAFSSKYITASVSYDASGRPYLFVAESDGGSNFSSTSANRDTLRIYQIVPEPTSALAMIAGFGAMILRRRSR